MAALPALADVADLEQRLMREFGTAETARAEQVLAEVSAAVRFETGKDWVSTTVPDQVDAPDMIVQITLRAADRLMRNPEGYTSESAGDYSYQRDKAGASEWFTDRELGMLRRLSGKSGLWTQPVTRGEEWCSTVWVNDQYGCDPIPYAVCDWPY